MYCIFVIITSLPTSFAPSSRVYLQRLSLSVVQSLAYTNNLNNSDRSENNNRLADTGFLKVGTSIRKSQHVE